MTILSIDCFNIYENIEEINNCLLILENKKFLYNFICDITSDSTLYEYIKIYENDKRVKTVDYIDFIPSLVHMDLNNKKNLNAIVRYLKQNNSEILNNYIDKINIHINDAFKYIKLESPIDIISKGNFDLDELFKIFNISIDDKKEKLLERICQYIDISYELRNTRVFIFYQLSSFLTENEIDLLIKNSNYKCVSIINIENQNVNLDAFDNKKIIDNDNCLLE